MYIFNLPSTVIIFSISHTLIHSAFATPVPRLQVSPAEFDQFGYELPQQKMATGANPSGLRQPAASNLGGGVVIKQQPGLTTASGTMQRPAAQSKPPPAGPQPQKTTTTTGTANGGMPSQPLPATGLTDVTSLRKELVIDPGIFKSLFYHPGPKEMLGEMPVMFITHIRGFEPDKAFSDAAVLMTNDQVVNKFRGPDFGLPATIIPKLKYYKIETSTAPPSAGSVKAKTVYALVDLESHMRKVIGAELPLVSEDIVIASDMTLVDVEYKADTMGKLVGDMSRGIKKGLQPGM